MVNSIKFRSVSLTVAAAFAATAASPAASQPAPIVQPGAPGAESRTLSADDAVKIADTRFSPDDVTFMQDMIPHHFQAVQMAALVGERTNTREIIDIAGRIDGSQADEIAFMQQWLRDRGQKAPKPNARHAMHTAHDMAGMASPDQIKALAAANGRAFDKMFLELMIPHHEGAVTMVEALLKQPGSAYDPVLFEFVNEVVNDQKAEIERMNAMLASLSDDVRATLKAGFRDAGEAIMNLELTASLPKPDGFFDPANPAGLPPAKPSKNKEEKVDKKRGRKGAQSNEDTQWGTRSPLLSFSNTDMAFAGDKLVAGNYHGFNIYQLHTDKAPELITSVVCPGGQGDISIVGDILIMSVEQTRGRVDCGLEGISEDVSPDRFRGLRIFDISDVSRPRQVGQVQTCRGSHTHSVVAGPGRNGKIIVYNSGTAQVRKGEELDGCVGRQVGDNRTALFRIDVIEIPMDDPSKARIIDSPAVFADPKTGRLAGLWQGGDHGDDTQETSETNQCHDITVFPAQKIAAGACSGNGIIFDISNPRKPKRIDEVVDKGFAYWHSATFNNDGTKVLYTDEWGGGSRPRCRASDPQDWGANAIYDIVDNELQFRGYYKMPAPQSEQENCVAHNGSVIPVPGRDIFVQAWYQGGISVIDFTDSSNPVEIAYFDRGPIDDEHLVLGGYWSTYWYQGKIYGTEITRGLDVLSLTPSEYLSESEIAAAALADQGAVFNPQQQFPVTWPAEPVVAHAYLDQLQRDGGVDGDKLADIRAALGEASDAMGSSATTPGGKSPLAKRLKALSGGLETDGADAQTRKRLTALSKTLRAIAGKV